MPMFFIGFEMRDIVDARIEYRYFYSDHVMLNLVTCLLYGEIVTAKKDLIKAIHKFSHKINLFWLLCPYSVSLSALYLHIISSLYFIWSLPRQFSEIELN